ncbi:MAG: hypothetical protein AAFN30_15390 [Actinomycetota bacterium]
MHDRQPPTARVAVDGLTTDGDETHLTGRAGTTAVRAAVPAVADEAQARRYLATVRRVDRVEIHLAPDQTSCQAIGRRSRLPFRSPIRLPVALGLARLGVPTVLTGLQI